MPVLPLGASALAGNPGEATIAFDGSPIAPRMQGAMVPCRLPPLGPTPAELGNQCRETREGGPAEGPPNAAW